jgi:SAM-dependent methyltransferase
MLLSATKEVRPHETGSPSPRPRPHQRPAGDGLLPPGAAMSEQYSLRDNPEAEAYFAARTAVGEAAFFLPHLRRGTQLLDVGCGSGSITLGLAQVVAPGEVVGIDLQAPQIERARGLAVEQTVPNVRFEVGDVYQLPFAADSFDAVFAHAVLMHLREPVRALVEMRRVLRPGGIVGVRDPDFGGVFLSPLTPLLEEWFSLRARVREYHGRDAFVGRHHRRLLLEAGFVRSEARASVDWSAGSLEETRLSAAWNKAHTRGWARTALAEGWVTEATIDAMMAELDAWAERPDAFSTEMYCATIGWTDG